MPDTDGGFSPDEGGDDSLFLTAYHRDFSVEGPARYHKNAEGKNVKGGLVVDKSECKALALGKENCDDEEYPDRLAEKYYFFGLEAYIHSGVRLALSMEGNFPDRAWDVSQLGLVFVSKGHWKTEAKARKAALSLIEEWNNHLSGNVYGYQIEDAEGNHLDSCWGYSGDYDAKDGILDEARAIADKVTNKGTTDEKGQYLMPFMAAA